MSRLRNEFLFIVLCYILFFSCDNVKKAPAQLILDFNIEDKYPTKEFDIRDLADVEYLVLQTNDTALFTHFVLLTDTYIVTYNTAERSFLFFDRKTREPVSKIARAGEGPEEYFYFWQQIYCEEEDLFYVYSFPDKIKVYSRYGDYKKTLNLRKSTDIVSSGSSMAIDAFFNFDDNYLLCHDKRAPSGKSFYFLSKKDGHMKDLEINIRGKIETGLRSKKDETGFSLYTDFDYCYVVKKEKGFLLTEPASDTIFFLTKDKLLIPKFVRNPSIHEMKTPVLLTGFLNTDLYSFFSTQEISYNFQTQEKGEAKGYLWDKTVEKFYAVKVTNKNYEGQRLLVSPALMFSTPIERTSNPKEGFLYLKSKKLLEDYEQGKLSGSLKELVESTPEEDLFVLMIMNFK